MACEERVVEDRIVLIDVVYKFIEKDQGYEAEIKVYIPEDSKGHIPSIFRNKDVKFCDGKLGPTWGYRSKVREGYRVMWIELYDYDLSELQKRVKAEIEEQIEKLRKVVRHNILARSELPDEEHLKFVI